MGNSFGEEINEFNNAQKCCFCKKEFHGNDIKVRDHDHYTGRYQGAAHSTCNKQHRQKNLYLVFFIT